MMSRSEVKVPEEAIRAGAAALYEFRFPAAKPADLDDYTGKCMTENSKAVLEAALPAIQKDLVERITERLEARVESARATYGVAEAAGVSMALELVRGFGGDEKPEDRCRGSKQISKTWGNDRLGTGGGSVMPCPGCPDCSVGGLSESEER